MKEPRIGSTSLIMIWAEVDGERPDLSMKTRTQTLSIRVRVQPEDAKRDESVSQEKEEAILTSTFTFHQCQLTSSYELLLMFALYTQVKVRQQDSPQRARLVPIFICWRAGYI